MDFSKDYREGEEEDVEDGVDESEVELRKGREREGSAGSLNRQHSLHSQ